MLKDELLGTETLPVAAMRMGYRSLMLRNAKGLRLQLASVLLRFHLGTTAERPHDISHPSTLFAASPGFSKSDSQG